MWSKTGHYNHRGLLEVLEKEEETHTSFAGFLGSMAPAGEGAGIQ